MQVKQPAVGLLHLKTALEKCRFIQSVRAELVEAFANMLIYIDSISTSSMRTDLICASLESNPNQGQYWLSYIDALIQTGQTDTARQVLAQGRQLGLNGEAVEALAGRLEEPSGSEPSPQEINTLAVLFTEGRYTEAAPSPRR